MTIVDIIGVFAILFVDFERASVVDVFVNNKFTLAAKMKVHFAVFKFIERVYNSEFVFHVDERTNIEGKTSIASNVMLFICAVL